MFLRKALCALVQRQVGSHEVHQVRGVLAIMDRESRIQPDALGILTQNASADAVERARPRNAAARKRSPRTGPGHDGVHAARHLLRRAPRESQQQYPARVGAIDDQPRDAVRQRVRFARPGPGNHKQRAILATTAVFYGEALLRVELIEKRGFCLRRHLLCSPPAARQSGIVETPMTRSVTVQNTSTSSHLRIYAPVERCRRGRLRRGRARAVIIEHEFHGERMHPDQRITTVLTAPRRP